MNNRIEAAYEQRPRRWVFELAVAVVVVALLIWSGSAVETAGTTQSGATIAWNILAGIFHPDTDLLFNLTTQGVPYLLLETICIAFLGTIVGAIISIPLAFLSASNLTPKPVAFLGRIIIMAVRTVPAFVYGLMFIRVTGPGAFAGLLTMSLCSVGMVSKMYIEAIEDLDVRVLESLDAAGCTTWQKIRYGILPQLMPNFASTAIYRFDINLRDATVLGLVGAGGIGGADRGVDLHQDPGQAGQGVSMEKTFQIYYTSDTHGHVFPVTYASNSPENAGLLNLAAQVEKDGNTLVLDGGDALQGTPLTQYYLAHREEWPIHPVAAAFNALGLVGAGGIGAPLIFAMNAYRWEEAGAILAGLIVLVLIVEWISTKIRVKLARG